VLGREFPLGLVKHVTHRPDDELERGLTRLQAGEFIYEQVAAGDVECVFKHALTQEVAYNTLLIERRKLLHERAGQALESMFADQLDDRLDELAHHYSRSDNVEKAVEYLGRAGQQAIQRAANADAISPLSAAIDLLQKLSDSPERVQRELVLQLALGPALLAVKGWGAPEAERAYTRARELCERAGDPSELFPVLFGLWNVHLLRAEARAAHELAGELLRWARKRQDPALLLYGHLALGGILFWMGELLLAREHVERAISLYEAEHHRALTSSYSGIDAAVWCRYFASQTLWELGYPDQALTSGNEAITMAQGLSHSTSLVFAEFIFCIVCQFRREARAAQEVAESVIALAAEHGLVDFLAVATSVRGWAMIAQGDEEEGIAQIQGGLAGYRATGSAAGRLYVLCMLAEACRAAGRHDDGLSAVAEGLDAASDSEYRNYEAETYRLKGELLLRRQTELSGAEQTSPRGASEIDESNAPEAQRCFERAIEIARKQSAKSWNYARP
jgi:predicted ATPase